MSWGFRDDAAANTTNPLDWHFKPNAGGACSLCGCTAKRLRAAHRRVEKGSYVGWEKLITCGFGADTTTQTWRQAEGMWW